MGDKEEVLYRFEVAVGGFKGLVIKPIIAQDVDGHHEILCPCRKCPRDMFLLSHDFQQCAASLSHLFDVFAGRVSLIEVAAVFLEGVKEGWVLGAYWWG